MPSLHVSCFWHWKGTKSPYEGISSYLGEIWGSALFYLGEQMCAKEALDVVTSWDTFSLQSFPE